jgi:hypothetical protein
MATSATISEDVVVLTLHLYKSDHPAEWLHSVDVHLLTNVFR